MRLGYMIFSNNLIKPLSRLKQAADLHSSQISQWLTISLLTDKSRGQRLALLREFYSKRCDTFANILDEHFAALATWQIPLGGLFFWLRLNQKIDLNEVLKKALKLNVAFMPQDHFFSNNECDAALDSYLRLNLSYANEEDAQRGLTILANLIRNT